MLSTLKTMYHLSEATGVTKSANFARTYMAYCMMHLVDGKGLFWWGWHRHCDVYTDQMTGHGGNVHELNAMHCIDRFRLWEINPPVVQREIEAIWGWHVNYKDSKWLDRAKLLANYY